MAMRENREHSAHCRLYLCAWCATSQRGGGRYSTHKPLALHLYLLNTCRMVYCTLLFCRARGAVRRPDLRNTPTPRLTLYYMFRTPLSYHFTRNINMFDLLQPRYAHVPFNGRMCSSSTGPIPHSKEDRERPPTYWSPSPVNPMLSSKLKSRAI